MTNIPQSSILSAEYNNQTITPNKLASLRGSGQFEPLPSNWTPEHGTEYKYHSDNKNRVGPNFSEQSPVGTHINNSWNTEDMKYDLRGDPYTQFGLKVTNETPTALSSLFFSKANVKYLGERIVNDVKQITGIQIKPQDENSLLVIMQNKYIYAESGALPVSPVHLALPRGSEGNCSMRERLTRLNQATLQEAIKQVLSGVRMYQQYYKDASSLPMPLSHPILDSAKGSKVLQEPLGFTPGNSKEIDSYNMRYSIIN